MKKSILFHFLLLIIFLFLVLLPNAQAQSKRTIHLKDGSILSGELVEMSNGYYTIKTGNLGTFKLHESKISSINDGSVMDSAYGGMVPPVMPGPRANNPFGAQSLQQGIQKTMSKLPPEAQAMQGFLLSNPELVQEIQGLASDPEITALLSDPALMEAIMEGDLDSIESNERAQALMRNPRIKNLIEKFGNEMGTP